MRYGEAKWILYPLGIKVKTMIPETEEESDRYNNEYDIFLDDDISGIRSLFYMVIDLNYIDNIMDRNDLTKWSVEALNPDWKTDYLYQIRQFYGRLDYYFEWLCEKEPLDSEEQKNEWCETKIEEMKSSGKLYTDKGIVEEFCRTTGRGSVIPIFLVEYNDDVKWIESHLIQKDEAKKRKMNPNSLKNLVQYRDKQVI